MEEERECPFRTSQPSTESELETEEVELARSMGGVLVWV